MKTILFLITFLHVSFSFSQTISLTSFGTGFSSPVGIENAGDSRLFIVEQGGLIRILNTNGTINANPFLDVSTIISAGGERGLLGLAFHPNYTTNGFFFVNYTNTAGNTVIARYSVSGNPNIANTTGTILMTITQPFSNHNGGCIKFGPDGFLYIGMGDGGSSGDPGNRAQNITENLGKMLRIDVNSTVSPFYTNPPTNPYIGIAGNDEIWAIGLRNPWKFSFNRTNGDLWIADVGQNLYEEVNKVSSTLAGLNYGWRCYEGNTAFNTTGCAAQSTMVTPITVPTHAAGFCSITGGYVYTGTMYPNLVGKYLFSDYCNPKIGMITSAGVVTYTANFTGNFVSFGEDVNGELYISDISNGIIYKIIDTSLTIPEFTINEYKIYPNPSKNEVYIERPTNSYPTEVQIFDLNGKLVVSQKTDNIHKNTIHTGFLSSGFYIMTIQNNLEETLTHKLLIE